MRAFLKEGNNNVSHPQFSYCILSHHSPHAHTPHHFLQLPNSPPIAAATTAKNAAPLSLSPYIKREPNPTVTPCSSQPADTPHRLEKLESHPFIPRFGCTAKQATYLITTRTLREKSDASARAHEHTDFFRVSLSPVGGGRVMLVLCS